LATEAFRGTLFRAESWPLEAEASRSVHLSRDATEVVPSRFSLTVVGRMDHGNSVVWILPQGALLNWRRGERIMQGSLGVKLAA